jgi:uridylate kinase
VVTALAVAREVSGLAAYLLVTVDADGANFTGAQAKAAADAIITAMRAGDALAEADINDILDGVVAGAGIVGTGNSTATVGNILAILGGAKFVVPVGTDVDDAYLTEAQQEALFDSDVYSPINDQDSSFWLSLARGQLRKAISSRVSRTGNVLDPLAVVYLADGTVAE